MGPEPLAHHIVPLHRRALAAWFNGTMRALAQAGIFGAPVTGRVEAPDLETTAASAGCGHVTRTRTITDTPGHGRESEVTLEGWKPRGLLEALTTMPLAVTGVPIHAPEVLSMPALVPQARAPVAAGEGLTVGCRVHTIRHGQGNQEIHQSPF